MKQLSCPCGPDWWQANKHPLRVRLDSADVVLEPVEFTTGALGWSWKGKVPVKIGAQTVACWTTIAVVVPGSRQRRPDDKKGVSAAQRADDTGASGQVAPSGGGVTPAERGPPAIHGDAGQGAGNTG